MNRLDAVTVMDVEIDVQDAQTVQPRPGDRQRRVVVDAEARRPRRHRVVEPAARMERVDDVAAQDRLDGPNRPAGDGRGGIVHAVERRVIAGPDPGLGLAPRIVVQLREALDRRDVAGGVAQEQLLVGGRLRRETGLRPDLAAAGRSPGRTGGASAGVSARSRRSASADRRRAAASGPSSRRYRGGTIGGWRRRTRHR